VLKVIPSLIESIAYTRIELILSFQVIVGAFNDHVNFDLQERLLK